MKLNTPVKLALIAVILSALTGGGNPVFIKIALNEIPPFSLNFLRFFLSFLLILPLFIKERPKINKESYKVILLSLLPVFNITLFVFGVRLTTATTGQTIYAAVPIAVGVFSYLILKERIGFNKIFGVLFGFIGTMIIVFLPIIGKPSAFKGDLWGNLLIFTAMISWTTYTVLSKKFQNKYSPIYLATFFILTTTVVEFFLALLDLRFYPNWWANISGISIFSVLYISILGTVVAYIFYQYAIKHGTPLIASMTLYLQPIATFLLAFTFLGERLTLGFVIGFILILLGTWKVTGIKIS